MQNWIVEKYPKTGGDPYIVAWFGENEKAARDRADMLNLRAGEVVAFAVEEFSEFHDDRE